MSDKNKKARKIFKMRRVLIVICIYEVYKGKIIIILNAIVHQSILEVCCVNFASLGIKYL